MPFLARRRPIEVQPRAADIVQELQAQIVPAGLEIDGPFQVRIWLRSVDDQLIVDVQLGLPVDLQAEGILAFKRDLYLARPDSAIRPLQRDQVEIGVDEWVDALQCWLAGQWR